MGCQTGIAETMLNRGADYVLALKGNQSEVCEEVKRLFGKACPEELSEQTSDTIDAGHDRIEQRRCRQIKVNEKWLPSSHRWPELQSVIESEATREEGDKKSTEKRYYVSSLSLDAEKVSAAIRHHWGWKINYIGFWTSRTEKMSRGFAGVTERKS